MGAIQRAPLGILDLFSIKGTDRLPTELLQDVRPSLDVLQFYALQQRQVLVTNDSALAEGGQVNVITASSPILLRPAVLFGASMGGIKTATMTAFSVEIGVTRGGGNPISVAISTGGLGPFGATETGPAGIVFWAPYPLILMPPWNIRGQLQILGTDATANCTLICEIGLLQ